jgi:hypothetical protein
LGVVVAVGAGDTVSGVAGAGVWAIAGKVMAVSRPVARNVR